MLPILAWRARLDTDEHQVQEGWLGGFGWDEPTRQNLRATTSGAKKKTTSGFAG
jgi:hypothetical protein